MTNVSPQSVESAPMRIDFSPSIYVFAYKLPAAYYCDDLSDRAQRKKYNRRRERIVPEPDIFYNVHYPEYKAWYNLIDRCRNPDHVRYAYYGGRGIKVCERWDSLKAFLEDMGLRPSSLYSIDRIDNNGDYEPSNCRWATEEEQRNNRRNSRYIEFDGRSQTKAMWAKELGITYNRLNNRLLLGWSMERVFEVEGRLIPTKTANLVSGG